jgi:hypothetical protein
VRYTSEYIGRISTNHGVSVMVVRLPVFIID